MTFGLKIIFTVSIITNVTLLICIVFTNSFSWTAKPRYGVLKQDIPIGIFGENKTIFILPKGLTVKDVSPLNQIDLFEPNHFSITITSDEELVDYNSIEHSKFEDLYSSKIRSSNRNNLEQKNKQNLSKNTKSNL